jgi:hypothetical protein
MALVAVMNRFERMSGLPRQIPTNNVLRYCLLPCADRGPINNMRWNVLNVHRPIRLRSSAHLWLVQYLGTAQRYLPTGFVLYDVQYIVRTLRRFYIAVARESGVVNTFKKRRRRWKYSLARQIMLLYCTCTPYSVQFSCSTCDAILCDRGLCYYLGFGQLFYGDTVFGCPSSH